MEKEIMTKPIDWEKYHVYMKYEGWCGVSTIKMIFNACNIKKSIYEIAFYTWKPWYGVPYSLLVAYLNRFFTLTNYRTNASIADISKHLTLGHIVIINFWDSDDGHYALVTECKKGQMTIVDSSRERGWQYTISTKELKEKWFDTLSDSLWHERFIAWVDPRTKRV